MSVSVSLPYQFPPHIVAPVNPHGVALQIQDDNQLVLADLTRDYLLVGGSGTTASNGAGKIIETLQIIAQRNYARSANERESDLEDVLRLIKEWVTNDHVARSIWLYRKNKNEAPKRALLFDSMKRVAQNRFNGEFAINGRSMFDLALTRHKLWESISVQSSSTTSLTLNGGVWDLQTAVNGLGTAIGRISDLKVNPSSAIVKTWVGIRSVNEGLTEFDPELPVSAAIVATGLPAGKNTDTTVNQVSGHADAIGNVAVTDFSTTTEMVPRWTVSLLGAFPSTTNYSDWIGRYRLILRYRTTATSTTLGLSMRVKWSGAAVARGVTLSPAYVEPANTDWQLIDLGTASIPPYRYRQLTADNYSVKETDFELSAERLSGAGNLECDRVFLMPERHSAFVDGEYSSGSELHLRTHEDDETIGYVNFSGQTAVVNAFQPSLSDDYGYPVGGGKLVILGQRSDKHVSTDTADLAISVIRRWTGRHG